MVEQLKNGGIVPRRKLKDTGRKIRVHINKGETRFNPQPWDATTDIDRSSEIRNDLPQHSNLPSSAAKLSSKRLILGTRVKLSNDLGMGVIRWIGYFDRFRTPEDIQLGIQLDAANGDHDGMHCGKRYFKTKMFFGHFCSVDDVVSFHYPKSKNFLKAEHNQVLLSDSGIHKILSLARASAKPRTPEPGAVRRAQQLRHRVRAHEKLKKAQCLGQKEIKHGGNKVDAQELIETVTLSNPKLSINAHDNDNITSNDESGDIDELPSDNCVVIGSSTNISPNGIAINELSSTFSEMDDSTETPIPEEKPLKRQSNTSKQPKNDGNSKRVLPKIKSTPVASNQPVSSQITRNISQSHSQNVKSVLKTKTLIGQTEERVIIENEMTQQRRNYILEKYNLRTVHDSQSPSEKHRTDTEWDMWQREYGTSVTRKQASPTKEFSGFIIGDRVQLIGDAPVRIGVVRWVEQRQMGVYYQDAKQPHLGIQLDDAFGEHDGIFHGKRYFQTKPFFATVCASLDVVSYKRKTWLRYKQSPYHRQLVSQTKQKEVAVNVPNFQERTKIFRDQAKVGLLRALQLGEQELEPSDTHESEEDKVF